MKKDIIGFIPARFNSKRFPGKPLAIIFGKPMVQKVYEQAKKSKLLTRVIILTDDKRIYKCVQDFNGEVLMTSRRHQSGSDRIGEVIEKLKCEIAVNIQGDEPFINPQDIDKAIYPLIKDKELNVSTLCKKINDIEEIENSNIVKVIFDKNKYALYFSRFPIPYKRDTSAKADYYKHIGLYAFRKKYLLKFISMKPSKLERTEMLEQLRIIEDGERIKVILTKNDSISVDTPVDLQRCLNQNK